MVKEWGTLGMGLLSPRPAGAAAAAAAPCLGRVNFCLPFDESATRLHRMHQVVRD